MPVEAVEFGLESQAAVNRIANALKAVNDQVDDRAGAAYAISDFVTRDREGARTKSTLEFRRDVAARCGRCSQDRFDRTRRVR